MEIRQATMHDMDDILPVFERARQYMRETGNPHQWKTTSPTRQQLEDDIARKNLYVITDQDGVQGVFALIFGEDDSYGYIEGQWLNDAPYATIHRVASAGNRHGILGVCLDYCHGRCRNLRIDTHEDNHVMQHLVEKYGFVRCGIIYLASNGEPRIAYQRTI